MFAKKHSNTISIVTLLVWVYEGLLLGGQLEMFPRLLCVIIKCLVTEVPVYVTCGEQKNAGQAAKPGKAIALTERGDFISFSSFVRTYMYLLPHLSCH